MTLLIDGRRLGALVAARGRGLAEGIERRHWWEGGPARSVALPESPGKSVCVDAIRRLAVGRDDGMSGLRVITVPRLGVNAVQDVADAMGESIPREGASQRLSALGARLRWSTWLMLCGVERPVEPAQLTSLQRLTDSLARDFGARAAWVFLVEDGAQDDLRWVEMASPGLPSDDGDDWEWYVRHRLIAEAGGRLDVAMELATPPSLWTLADDASLERYLERTARERFSALPDELQAMIASALARPERVGRLPRRDLETARGREPAPWVVRGYSASAAKVAPWLWRAVVCRPVASALLQACAELESAERAGRSPIGMPDDEALRVAGEYERPDGRERPHYHAINILRPTMPWDFATFGAWLSRVSSDRRRVEALHALRSLRNHLAHGHHAGWHAVSVVRRLHRELVA